MLGTLGHPQPIAYTTISTLLNGTVQNKVGVGLVCTLYSVHRMCTQLQIIERALNVFRFIQSANKNKNNTNNHYDHEMIHKRRSSNQTKPNQTNPNQTKPPPWEEPRSYPAGQRKAALWDTSGGNNYKKSCLFQNNLTLQVPDCNLLLLLLLPLLALSFLLLREETCPFVVYFRILYEKKILF